jgi:hypothetical protein
VSSLLGEGCQARLKGNFIAPDFGVSIEKYEKQIRNELPAVALG